MMNFIKSSKRNFGFISTTSLAVLSALLSSPEVQAMDELEECSSPRLHVLVSEEKRMEAEAGDVNAQLYVANVYFTAGSPDDIVNALMYYNAAADQGNVIARRKLANMYYDGKVVEQDYKLAVHHLLRLDLTKVDSSVIYRLGHLYLCGKGVEKNHQHDKQAFQWFMIAADKGHAGAQYQTGIMYEDGQGVKQDSERARWYFEQATKQGHELARERFRRQGCLVLGG